MTLEPSYLMTEKLITFIDRDAGRDIFDAWFILNNAYPLNESMIQEAFGDERHFYQTIFTNFQYTSSLIWSMCWVVFYGHEQIKRCIQAMLLTN